jgi:AmpD protein
MQTESTPETLWLDGVHVAPSPNFDERPDCPIDLLVIHNISLPPGQFGGPHIKDFFCNQLDCHIHPFFREIENLKVSAHFLIDRDGQVTQFVPLDKRAWHAGASNFSGRQRCNDFSIGIEMEGTDDGPYTEAQYQSLTRLTREIQRHYPAITRERITGHSDISPGRKTDPGPFFDWEKYRALLQF